MLASIRDQAWLQFLVPPIIPRERFGADHRDLLRVGDILIGQARRIRAHAFRNFSLQSSRSAPVDPADRHAAPDHGVIVSVALAGDCGGAEG